VYTVHPNFHRWEILVDLHVQVGVGRWYDMQLEIVELCQ
jgi:hypothetical protein